MKYIYIVFMNLLLANPGYRSYLNDSSNPENYGGDGIPIWLVIVRIFIIISIIRDDNS